MKITDIIFHGGARERITKLGLANLFIEIQETILSTKIFLLEQKDANGGAVVRKMIDESFEKREDWVKKTTGDIDWSKRVRYNRTFIATIGVEVQVSARSDLLIRDLVHIRNNLKDGLIEVGVIIVPNNSFQVFLPDRTPSIKDAIKYIEEEFIEAQNYPIVVIGIEHDGPGEALKKQKRKG